MPRKARRKSGTGVYHITARGVNGQAIFLDDKDRIQFLTILRKIKEKYPFELLAYCLMSNHIHLLVREGEEGISQLMQRLGSSYVFYFNNRHERYGHLFQDRFWSEIVEDEGYLLRVVRYILQNPVKAFLVEHPRDYPWSSYLAYIHAEQDRFYLTDTKFILSFFGNTAQDAIDFFIQFINVQDLEPLRGGFKRQVITNEDLRNIIIKLLNKQSLDCLHDMSKKKRDRILRMIKSKNIPVRQIAEVTGFNRNVVQRA
jgi:REP element-mobilizing transposase RayT